MSKGHGNVVAFFFRDSILENRVFTQATFPLSDANTALDRDSRLVLLYAEGGRELCIEVPGRARLTGDKSAMTAPSKYYFDSSQDERVEREIRALEGFRHPNLASIVEHGHINLSGESVRYVAWEYIDGDPLDAKLRAGPVTANTVACIGRDVARAIDHIWSKRDSCIVMLPLKI